MGFPVKAAMTHAGRDLLGRTHSGDAFKITRAVLGEGELLGQDPRALENVIGPVMEAHLAHVSAPQGGKVIARFAATKPGDIPRDFYWRELGVYVYDKEAGHEILYVYNNAGAYPDHIAQGETGMRTISVPIEIGEASEVVFELDQSVAYALADEYDAHVNDLGNPHNVTLGQVLGGGAAYGEIDCGEWDTDGTPVQAHNSSPAAHGNMIVDGNAFGEYEAGELAAHETDPNVHQNIIIDGNI